MRSIELFAGAGGMALGLERAGFASVALYERNADACATLRLNRPGWTVVEGDVREVDFSQVGPVDLVAGGPPCQPFSMGGKARGYEDTRDMFPQSVRAVRELLPPAFLFENVRGLLRPAFANYVEYIRLQLAHPTFPISRNVDWTTNLRRLQRFHSSARDEAGASYAVMVHLADAANYGVPQRRHRVFFVGFRNDLDVGWSFPPATHTQDDLIVAKYVSGEYWREFGLSPEEPPASVARRLARLATGELLRPTTRWRTVRDALNGLPHPREASSPECNHVFQPGARSYPGHTGSPLDEPAKALKAGDHGVPGGENMLRHANGEVRYFTVRESARIQTFPDDFRFPGSWTESMRQLGNAVPVKLAEAVGRSIARRLRMARPGRRRAGESAVPPLSLR